MRILWKRMSNDNYKLFRQFHRDYLYLIGNKEFPHTTRNKYPRVLKPAYKVSLLSNSESLNGTKTTKLNNFNSVSLNSYTSKKESKINNLYYYNYNKSLNKNSQPKNKINEIDLGKIHSLKNKILELNLPAIR